jgi:bla regulator protein blaR1
MRARFSILFATAITAIVATRGSALFAQDTSGMPKAMAADARPQLEVATIKPSQSREAGGSLKVNPSGLVNLMNFPVMVLIQFSYNVPRRQISGGPSWLESERFDIVGKPDMEGAPSMSQLRAMLLKLLADRFQLSLHHEKKQLSVYALTLGKGGPKLTENTDNPNGLPTFRGSGGLQGRNVLNSTMAEFASDLQGRLADRPVVDQTGLGSRRYDFILKWTPDAPAMNGATGAPPAADNPDAPPDIFAAIQMQLGLKLESTKAPVDVIVIDHVGKPSEN